MESYTQERNARKSDASRRTQPLYVNWNRTIGYRSLKDEQYSYRLRRGLNHLGC